jgi:meso-butanediol dehydrogenase/(S,S)-butanediol dehydrogenase/diacetyl reductase
LSRQEVAFVTGAASGIGRATAEKLAARGAALGLLDLDEAGLTELAAQLRDLGTAVFAKPGDASDDAVVCEAVQATVEQLGPLTTTVACAGREFLGRVTELPLEDWHRSLAINLTSSFLVARHAIPQMIAAGGGALVIVGSTTSISGGDGWAPYATPKHGLVGLVRCMALDHARDGVRCNAVLPGFISTAMTDRLMADVPQDLVAEWDAAIPLGRRGRAAEVANAVAHLTSDEATYVTGALYVIDGGETVGAFNGSAS